MNVVFLYPSRRVGGAQLLFVRMARELSRRNNIQVFVADYEDGFLRKQLEKVPQVKILPYVNECVHIDFEANIITPLSNIGQCEYMVSGNRELLAFYFWTIHPDNLAGPFSRRKYLLNSLDKVKRNIALLSRLGVILYMDSSNYLSVQSAIAQPFEPVYLPVPIATDDAGMTANTGPRDLYHINIAWLGRVSEDKVHTIIDIAEQVKLMSSESDIALHFHIIGNGECDDMLAAHLKRSGIRYTLAGTLTGAELNAYMEQVDLGVAMGTSSLEFAIRKIPVVLLDYSHHKYPPKMKYNWLFETEGYSLGSDIRHGYKRKHSFSEIIGLYLCKRAKIAAACYAYAKRSHDINAVADKLHAILQKGQDPASRQLLQSVFSYLNPGVYKLVYRTYAGLRRTLSGFHF